MLKIISFALVSLGSVVFAASADLSCREVSKTETQLLQVTIREGGPTAASIYLGYFDTKDAEFRPTMAASSSLFATEASDKLHPVRVTYLFESNGKQLAIWARLSADRASGTAKLSYVPDQVLTCWSGDPHRP
jgi:hypothetical protein